MTKTLTEQWRDGEWIVCNAGKCDYYYTDVKCYNGSHKEVIKEESVFLSDYDPDYEILGKVPSYDEYKRLQKRIEIATKALKEYARGDSDAGNGCLYEMPAPSLAQQALKEMEGVK